jgi:Holliday junction resolvase RusA-like endonuclease
MRVDIKPLSVNQCWQGKRFKTKDYLAYENEMFFKLKPMTMPDSPYYLKIEVGMSSSLADIDNFLKPFIDILQKKYGFNDKLIYKLSVKKIKVAKGDEYIDFDVTNI